MTLQQALKVIQENLPAEDMTLVIRFNSGDVWAEAVLTETGTPSEQLYAFTGEGYIDDAIIGIAEGLIDLE